MVRDSSTAVDGPADADTSTEADPPAKVGTARRSSGRLLPSVAWTLVLVGTLLPTVLADEVFGSVPAWLLPAQLVAVGAVLLLTVVDERFRPLRVFAAAVLVARLQLRVSASLLEGLLGRPIPAGVGTLVAHELLQFLLTATLLAVLVAAGYRRGDLFLRSSDLSSVVDSVRIPGLRGDHSWRWLGVTVGGPVVVTTAGFLIATGAGFEFGRYAVGELAGLLAVVVAVSAVNAFNEEFVFRAAPLADLGSAVGERRAALVPGAFFGFSHYYGTPGGVPGVLMSFFLGWFLAKSMLGTRGITFAWTLHFVLDVLIFSAMLT